LFIKLEKSCVVKLVLDAEVLRQNLRHAIFVDDYPVFLASTNIDVNEKKGLLFSFLQDHWL